MISTTRSGYVWVGPTSMAMMAPPLQQEEEEALLQPTWRLYANILVAVLQALQFGWSTSQMNNSIFNNEADCNARPIAPGTCLMFPGHTKTQWTIAVSSWIVGGMLGSLVTGRISNKFGRKPTMMANCLFMIAGAAVQATSSNISVFTVGRVFAGIAAGGSTAVIPGFIGEICPPHLRSRLGVCFQISITLGHLLSDRVGVAFPGVGSDHTRGESGLAADGWAARTRRTRVDAFVRRRECVRCEAVDQTGRRRVQTRT
ncbi:hypothetical protein ON010_g13174 [Phytophthora cinnamomi]|nr:hypothetical protein ON010_g13174 [Phytophthora cinnamomi]